MSTDRMPAATGPVGPLHERIEAIATQLTESASHGTTEHAHAPADLAEAMMALAVWLIELARECEEEYVHAHAQGDTPTPAQGFALGRFLRRGWRGEPHPERYARVRLGGAGLPDDHLHVRLSDGCEGSIDREGRVSR